MTRRTLKAAAGIVAALWFGHAAAQSPELRARLSTVPIDPASQATTTGEGSVTARLEGRTLVVDGTFEGLQSAATAARLYLGAATGVRGPAIHDLDVTPSADGVVAASVTLSASEIEALSAGRLYVQIDSEAAPEGNLWGWLLPQDQ